MTIGTRSFAPACLFLTMLSCLPVAAATDFFCDTASISVEAASRGDAELACSAAAVAISRLAALGLPLREPVRIEVREMLEHVPGACAASYNVADREIHVLSTKCLEDPPARVTAFSEVPAGVLFESLIVHELTHAVIEQWQSDRVVPRIVHEYLAYAIQLDTMPSPERAQILEKANVPDPLDIARINEGILSFAPHYFAAASWLFFTAEGGDAAHVQRALDGDLLMDSLME